MELLRVAYSPQQRRMQRPTPQPVHIRIEDGLRWPTRAHCGSRGSPLLDWTNSEVGGSHGPSGKGCAANIQPGERYNQHIAPGRDIQVRRRRK